MENTNNSRREFIKTAAVVGAGAALLPSWACKTSKNALMASPAIYPAGDGFIQEPLPYSYSALEPHIDARTMEIHYTKHHAAYIKNLNAVATHKEIAAKSLEEILQRVSKLPEDIRTTVRNNGGGHWNHTFFWKIMSAPANTAPAGEFLEAINKGWGGLETFKTEFEKAASSRFGSGWAWLVKTKKGLEITSTANQDNPLMDVSDVQGIPVLGVDVWEHAYYLHYQNRRGDYLKNFWNVVNWPKVQELYTK